MRRHLNTLFVTIDGAYLRKDGAAIEIHHEGATKLRVPLHNLDGIVCFGWDCTASASLMGACAEANVSLSFHTPHGKFLAASNGFTPGNIHLRRTQYRAADNQISSLSIARNIVAAKITNCRNVLQRAVRDHGAKFPDLLAVIDQPISQLANRANSAMSAVDLDSLRGIEGDAATSYFAAFPKMLTNTEFIMNGRSRRPPADPINALLSFLYSLLAHDCRSALESCGLDSQCGFLHRDRPGRPSLALDLMEEFRPILADRAALTLVNRRQLTARHFESRENGGVYLRDDARKIVLEHWQERKQTEITHPLLRESMTVGLLSHIQARLLARHLRGDLDAYPAFLSH